MFAPFEVFGSLREQMGECGHGCEGYCPAEEMTGLETDQLVHLEVAGTRYVSDRYVAILTELVDLDRADKDAFQLFGDKPVKSGEEACLIVPDTEPGPSTQPLNAARVGRITELGASIREGGHRRPQHLYDDGRHIGWLMVMSGSGDINDSAITLTDLPEARRLLHDANNDWDEAARLLHIIRPAVAGGMADAYDEAIEIVQRLVEDLDNHDAAAARMAEEAVEELRARKVATLEAAIRS
ncbi:hypothetical protein ATK17_3974 [Branchiibius hedensis]|uniref:Uncharacterized protein n=1 Tax=Branchiibius hedensis TaxID=672460 RepID=A0A2Y9BNH2_9MICO|nr:hypothetical protein [Branchiibius hedensis]PWJ22805.1 hypothetical protein ATK17_3974 [Branchiibius hedensis]SSA59154.1 hypothetical protein SAMN04489750_3974 [Branchiibius hedensis]